MAASSLFALRRSTAALASTSNPFSSSSSSLLLPTSRQQQQQQQRRRKPLPSSPSSYPSSTFPPRRRIGRAVFAEDERSRSPPPAPSAKGEVEGDGEDLELGIEEEEQQEEEEEEDPEEELDRSPRARPSPKGSLSRPNGLAASAAAFAADVKAGISPEDLAAAALGARGARDLTEAQQRYAEKVAAALAARAEADARAKAERAAKFELGKALYAKGMYPQSVGALINALDAEGPFTQLGGEIQLWLGLAYSATGDEAAAVEVYKEVEASHPSPKMRRQAYDLRYIAEAPKLRVGADEKPLLPEVEAPRIGGEKDRRRAPRPPPAPRGAAAKRSRPKALEVKNVFFFYPSFSETASNGGQKTIPSGTRLARIQKRKEKEEGRRKNSRPPPPPPPPPPPTSTFFSFL